MCEVVLIMKATSFISFIKLLELASIESSVPIPKILVNSFKFISFILVKMLLKILNEA